MKTQGASKVKDLAKNCESVAQLMKAMAHPLRLMILCHLSTGEKSVGELEELCGAGQSQVSQFLNRMRLEGLVASEKRGLYVHYRILDVKVKKLITALHHIYCS